MGLEFNALWEALKLELNLTDGDLDMKYKIQVSNSIAILGFLRKGKVALTPTSYSKVAAAVKARDNFIGKTGGKLTCKILQWGTSKEIEL